MLVGSGGLSHDPPLPTLATATSETKAFLTNGAALSHGERVSRQNRIMRVGYEQPDTSLRPLNPEWDRKILDSFARCELDVLDGMEDEALSSIAGSGAHELRSWVAALAAANTAGTSAGKVLFYEPIEEWITGMGIMTARPETRPN
jgi:2,3-dihydroxyphenylpropionate 1,2-dioxygenase